MDLLERFPLAWCRACQRVQPTLTFEVFEADDKTDYDAVDLICGECQSIIATLHAPRESRTLREPRKPSRSCARLHGGK
jgi:hypothetical protein